MGVVRGRTLHCGRAEKRNQDPRLATSLRMLGRYLAEPREDSLNERSDYSPRPILLPTVNATPVQLLGWAAVRQVNGPVSSCNLYHRAIVPGTIRHHSFRFNLWAVEQFSLPEWRR